MMTRGQRAVWWMALALGAAAVISARSAEVGFEWDASRDPSVIGYRLYWQTNAPGRDGQGGTIRSR